MSGRLPPIGFWSYARTDDEDSYGWLRKLRLRLSARLRQRTGDRTTKIWQDQEAIPTGADWAGTIDRAIAESSFFVPIITPAFLHSEWCCKELVAFATKIAESGRTDLIFPVHYIDVGSAAKLTPRDCHDPAVLPIIRRAQWINFTNPRWHAADPDAQSEPARELLEAIYALAHDIRESLHKAAPATPPGPGVGPPNRVVLPPPGGGPTITPPPSAPAIIRRPQPGDIMRDAPDLPEMVLIPPGEFQMGIPAAETKGEGFEALDKSARPVHTVRIAQPFWLGRYPVTRGEFAAFIQATGYSMPDEAWTYESDATGKWDYARRKGRNWRNPGFPQDDRHPVTCISHDDALAYVKWLNDRTGGDHYRLPSEAEWEYAARAGTTTARYWGDGTEQAHRYANMADQSLRRHLGDAAKGRAFMDGDDGHVFTAPVGSFEANRFGLHDMLGNVWEWCADPWHGDYQGAPADSSVWETNGDSVRRVLRGGSWVSDPRVVRAGVRYFVDFRDSDFGCRLARTSF